METRYNRNLYWFGISLMIGGIVAMILGCTTVPSGKPVEWKCIYSDRGPYMTVEHCGPVKDLK